MIKGQRSILVPDCLQGTKAEGERQRATTYYTDFPNGLPSFDGFAVYRGPTVKLALSEMFRAKCAYCESPFVNHGVHVEHFRPKGRVKLSRDGTPQKGYWWLASQWENLLPTCIDCNTEVNHTLPDGTTKKIGKGDYFPLSPGQTCASAPGYLHTETPTLIDPSTVNPKEYFEFSVANSNGKSYSLVRSKKYDLEGQKRAEVSIDAYGLNRHRLVVQRTARLSELESDLFNWRDQLLMVEQIGDPNQKLAASEKVAARFASILEAYVSPDKPYSAACAAFVQHWLDLIKLGVPDAQLQDAVYS